MTGFIKSNTQGWILSKVLLLGGAWISILWSVYFAVVTISIPYPIEFREGAAQVMTDFLLSGNNPFVFENQPLAMNNYGLGYNLIVLPFAWLFGNTLLVHRLVTFLFVLLSAATGFIVIHTVRRELAPASTCAAFIMIGLIAHGGIGAFPSALGTFLFLMTLVIPFFRGFDPPSLLLSILFSIAAFYSKAYFIVGFGIVASYLFLFASKKTGLLYSVVFSILFAISILVVRLAFPLYFIDTLIGNISNGERSSTHLFSQLRQLLIYFSPVLLSLFLFAFEARIPKRSLESKLKRRDREQLPMGVSAAYFLYSSVCALLAFIVILGPHIGNYLNYAYQLIIPVFFCWFFLKFDPRNQTGLLIAATVVFNLFFWGRSTLAPHMLEQKDSQDWASLYSQIRSSSNILNSPVVTSAVVELGLHPLDSGQTSYFYEVNPYPNLTVLGPSYDAFRADGLKYVRFIDNSIQKQRYDLILTTQEKSTFYHAKLIKKFYAPVAEIKVDMPQTGQQWTVLLWKPIRK